MGFSWASGDDHRVTAPVFANGNGDPGGGPNLSGPVEAFTFRSLDAPKFKSFVIPDAFTGGGNSYTVKFGGMTQLFPAGVTVDFTQVDPAGVASFQISSPANLTGDASGTPAFVWGATHSEAGMAMVNVTSLPGDYNYDGTVDGADLLYWQRDIDETTTRFADADGDGS